MFFKLIICAFLSLFLAESQQQVIGVGDCPTVEVVQNFDVSKYTGLWYEYERYPLIFEFLGKCVTATYSAQSDGKVGVFNQQINELTGAKQEINGTASFEGSPNEAKLTVIFPVAMGAKGNYWVLGTDYDNYSVVWSCTKLGYFNLISSWILTREAKPSQDTINKANEIVKNNKVDTKHFSKTDQTNCPGRT